MVALSNEKRVEPQEGKEKNQPSEREKIIEFFCERK